MPNDELRQLLEKLHTEIGRTQSVDAENRDLLRHLENDVRTLLTRTEKGQPAGLTGRLEDAINTLEVSHPALTQMLSE
ncbi:MAG TPA: DUF4404 family protein, partial [Anaerolineales bacterium]|nr:DUF4404 family protein [Anaerolineales bacterium]